MKQSNILKILNAELKTSNLEDANKALKAKDYSTKFRITGPTLVHFGFTGLIKALTNEGVKVYNTNKVNLIRYDDIETFAKAIPREERKGPPKKEAAPQPPKKQAAPAEFEDEDDEDYDNDDDFDEYADEADDVIEDKIYEEKLITPQKKKPVKKLLGIKGSGSLFIPKKK